MDDSVPLERGERYGETTCIIDALPLCELGLGRSRRFVHSRLRPIFVLSKDQMRFTKNVDV